MYVCVCSCLYTCIYKCRYVEADVGCLSLILSTYFFFLTLGLSGVELTNLAGGLAGWRGPASLCLPRLALHGAIIQLTWPCLVFCMGSGDLNGGPSAYRTSTALTKLSPQLPNTILASNQKGHLLHDCLSSRLAIQLLVVLNDSVFTRIGAKDSDIRG